jgi:hypothetical protein
MAQASTHTSIVCQRLQFFERDLEPEKTFQLL